MGKEFPVQYYWLNFKMPLLCVRWISKILKKKKNMKEKFNSNAHAALKQTDREFILTRKCCIIKKKDIFFMTEMNKNAFYMRAWHDSQRYKLCFLSVLHRNVHKYCRIKMSCNSWRHFKNTKWHYFRMSISFIIKTKN